VVILSVVSAKGGVGKTTITANMATALAQGRSVMAVDLDPQNALRLHLGVPVEEIDGVGRATLEQRGWNTCLFRATAGPYVLPYGNLNESDRDAFEVHLSSDPDWLVRGLRQGLGLGAQDLVVVDTPPGPSLYQQQALRFANFVLIVIHADPASYATLPAMESILHAYCNNRSDFFGAAYLINNVVTSSPLARDVVRVIRSELGSRMVPNLIHQDEAVKEALAFDQLVLQYAPHSEAANDIAQTAAWLSQQLIPAFKAGKNFKS
jgi:cellulose synthase operon protein YhjQ